METNFLHHLRTPAHRICSFSFTVVFCPIPTPSVLFYYLVILPAYYTVGTRQVEVDITIYLHFALHFGTLDN